MKYKIGDTFLTKAVIESIDEKRSAPYFVNSSIGCGYYSEHAFKDSRMMNCNGCKWKGNRYQKCSCCMRNSYIKDNYEWE